LVVVLPKLAVPPLLDVFAADDCEARSYRMSVSLAHRRHGQSRVSRALRASRVLGARFNKPELPDFFPRRRQHEYAGE
jgi:hypothetical protein